MKRIERPIEILPKKIKKIDDINLLKVIDYSTYQDITNNNYYQLDSKYGSKMYRDIGLKSYGYMKVMNGIDNQIGNRLILDRLRILRYEVYEIDSNLIIISREFKDNLLQLENKINELEYYNEIYELRKNSKLIYIIKNGNTGYLIEIDLIEERVEIYLLEVIDKEYLLLDKYSEGGGIEVIDNANSLSLYYGGDIDSRYYNYEELERIVKDLKVDNIEEIDLDRMDTINDYRKKIEFSRYSIKDLYEWIFRNLNKIDTNIIKYYREVEERRLAYDLSKEDN